jgi:mono/diheme cytochrome c family protein
MSRPGLLAAAAAACALAASVVAWQPTSTTPAASATGPLDGSELFQRKGCATCHTGPESNATYGGFPLLADAPTWAGDREPGLGADEYIATSIRTPSAFLSPAWVGAGGGVTAMPDLGLTEAEIGALVHYLLRG